MVELPEWVPDDIRPFARVEENCRLVVTLRRSSVAQVVFDEVPDSWTIEISDLSRVQPVTISAARPGTRVVWHLRQCGGYPVRIERGVRSVRLSQPAPAPQDRVQLSLTENGVKLRFHSPGSYAVDSAAGDPVTYQAWAKVNAESVISLSGTAKLTSLRGTGTVHLQRLELDQLDFDGNLKAEVVSITKLALTGKLTCKCLVANSVEAAQVEVGQPLQSGRAKMRRTPPAPAVEIRDSLTAGHLHVTGEVKGIGDTPARLHLTGTLKTSNLTNVHVTAGTVPESAEDSAERLSVDIAGTGAGCSFTGPIDKIAFGTVKDSLTVEAATSVTVVGDCTGRYQVSADSLRLNTVRGRGTLSAKMIMVAGQVDGDGDGLILTAEGRLQLGSTARNTALLCGASSDQPVVVVGYPNGRRTQLHEPALSTDTIRPAVGDPGSTPRPPDTLLDGCVVLASGDVAVKGSISSSLLRVDGQLQLEGDLDCSAPTTTDLVSSLPTEYRQRLGTSCDDEPVTACQVLVTGDVRLGQQQVVRVTSLFSAASLDGGAVELKDSVSTFVAGRVARTRVSAHDVGVVDAPEQSTLIAAGLMHLINGAPTENTLTFKGSGTFGAAVQCPLTWEPDGNHVCSLGAAASFIRVASRDLPADEDGPLLRIADGHPVKHLCLKGWLRVESERPEAGKRTRHSTSGGQSQATEVSKLVTLGACARLHLGSGLLDLGDVELTADATIGQDRSQHSHLVAGLRPVGGSTDADELNPSEDSRGNPALTVFSGTRIRLVIPRPGQGYTAHGSYSMPTLRLDGNTHAVVATALEEVICISSSGSWPKLSVEASGRIASLTGPFDLSQLHGRISSSHHRKTWKVWKRDGHPPARLRQITASQDDHGAVTASGTHSDLEGGQLIGVDVTRVSYADVQKLSHLHVFDPDGRTLMSHAREANPQAGKHERAQRLKLLADAVSTRAASGNTRSAVMWASARAHHAVVNVLEKAIRCCHWALGYGYRPAPAFLTYLTWLIGTGAVLMLVDGDPRCESPDTDTARRFVEGPYDFWQQIARVLLLPTGLLRLELGGATTYAPIRCSAGWHTAVFAVTGFLLVYLVLAIRNYLRTPGGTGHP